MCGKLYCYSAVAIIAVLLAGCAAHPGQAANNCQMKDQEIPAGYSRDECHCVKAAVQADYQDVEWEHMMGRRVEGETTGSTAAMGDSGLSGTTAIHWTHSPDHSIQCSRTRELTIHTR